MGHDDVLRLRVSDEDRHKVTEVLRQAAGEGRLDLDELDERLGLALGAKTYADLVPLTADLPAAPTPHPPAVLSAHTGPRPTYAASLAVMSETRREGPWAVGESHQAFALMGSVVLDLREAAFSVPETVVNAYAVMAGVEVIVNAGTQVVVDGFGVMGDFKQAKPKVPAELAPTSPVVRVRGLALMGSVVVRRKAMPGEEPRRRLGMR